MSRRRRALHRLGEEPIYCKADPSEIIHKGLANESFHGSSSARISAYEASAARFLGGCTRPILTATLRGPFDKSFDNPWKYRESKVAPPIVKPVIRSTTKPSGVPLSIVSRTGADKQTTTCHLPSPVSLDHKVCEETHDYLGDEDLDRVEVWRSSVIRSRHQPDAVWAPPPELTPGRKRRANSTEWLKGVQNKRRRTQALDHTDNMDQLSIIAHGNDTSPAIPMPSSDPMDEDEIQAHVQSEASNTSFETPSRRSPSRRGFHRSPRRGLETIESDDELSKPSDSIKKPCIWKAASARSQISRHAPATSPRSSPSRRFLRATTTTPGTEKVVRSKDKTTTPAEFETQQDNSFIFRARKKKSLQPRPTLLPGPCSSDAANSDITSPGRVQIPTTVHSSHIQVPDSPYKLPSAGEQVQGPRNATPESDIIPTSQPAHDSKALSVARESSPYIHPSSPHGQVDNAPSAISPLQDRGISEGFTTDDSRLATPIKDNTEISVAEQACVEAHSDLPSEPQVDPQVEPQVESPVSPEAMETSDAEVQTRAVAEDQVRLDAAQAMVDLKYGEESMAQASALPEEPPSVMDEPSPSPVKTTATLPDEGPATTESQQSPWQASVPGPACTVSLSDDHLERPQSQLSDPPAFSQAVEPIRNESQQTPWCQDAHYSPLLQVLVSSNPSPIGATDSPETEGPWARRIRQAHEAAQLAISSLTWPDLLSEHMRHSMKDPLPDNVPEDSRSVASGDTPSLHTAPSTPTGEGPDTVFEDASSPRDGQVSATPKDTSFQTGFVLKPFAAFRSPTPELRSSPTRNRGMSCRIGARSRSILVRRDPSTASTRTKKLVSWASLNEQSNDSDGMRASPAALAMTRSRASSPPPDQALANLPTGEKDPFRKHFSAIKKKAKGHRHRILPSASQQVWRSPSPTAMASAFIMADELAKSSRGAEAPAEKPDASPVAISPEVDESFDDVDEVLRNLGDFLDMVDVEADVEKAKADLSAGKTSEKMPLAAGGGQRLQSALVVDMASVKLSAADVIVGVDCLELDVWGQP